MLEPSTFDRVISLAAMLDLPSPYLRHSYDQLLIYSVIDLLSMN